MAIELNKNEKNLNQYIDYVNNQINYTGEELKSILAQRGLSEARNRLCNGFDPKGRNVFSEN